MTDNFGGPKKPRATFGDVMRGIPAGKGGEAEGGDRRPRGGGDRGPRREGGGGGGDRGPRREGGGRDRGPREEKPAQAAGEAPAGEGQAPAEGQKREARKPEKREKGPLVVVRRASGQVETREAGAPAEGASSEAAAPESQESQAPAEAAAPPPKKPSRRNDDSLFQEVPEDQSFAEMFEQAAKSEGPRKSVRIGEKVKGKIFQLGADTAFVTLGGKSEAMIELRELKDEEGILRLGVGDEIEAHVVEAGAKGIILSRSLSKGSASVAMLAEARASGMPVEGMVLSVNKGGLEIAIGDVRAFCPVSQIDVRFVEKPELLVGEKHKFRVIEMRDKKIVVSRRALLEEELKVKAAALRKELAEGKVVKGTITSVRDFGAFADLGGIEGMIPVSELSHSRVGHPSEVVKVGDEVEVEIIRLEPPNPNSPDKAKQKERITLSLRSRQEDPFKALVADLHEGQQLKGKVVRLQPFGAFVELKPGVDGLIHISALSNRRVAHPKDVVQVGQEVDVTVEKIDPAEKRIGLRLVTAEEAAIPAEERQAKREAAAKVEEGPKPKVGAVGVGKIDRIEPYGVFLKFPGGKGLVPASETGTERGTDMKRHFAMDQELKVQILEIDQTGKIRLSVTAAERAEERAEMEQWKASQPKGGGKAGFGTLGDILAKKFKK